MNRGRQTALVFALAMGALVGVAHAQSTGRDSSRVDGSAGSGIDGRAAINLAAGSSNAQANVGAIGAGANARVDQAVLADPAARSRDASAIVSGQALASGTGALAFNQVAGSGNAQANLLAIGTGPQDLGVDVLATVSAGIPIGALPAAASGSREARIDPAALQGHTGILQVNQTAGVGNASTNAIVLQLPGGTP